MSPARALHLKKRQKTAYHFTLLRVYAPNYRQLPTSEVVARIGQIRRKGKVDALDVLMTSVGFGLCLINGETTVLLGDK